MWIKIRAFWLWIQRHLGFWEQSRNGFNEVHQLSKREVGCINLSFENGVFQLFRTWNSIEAALLIRQFIPRCETSEEALFPLLNT